MGFSSATSCPTCRRKRELSRRVVTGAVSPAVEERKEKGMIPRLRVVLSIQNRFPEPVLAKSWERERQERFCGCAPNPFAVDDVL